MEKILILVDHSNLVYRAYYSSVHHLDGKPWLPILRYFDMLRLAVIRSQERYPGLPVEILFAGESRKILQRTKLDKTYKAHRKKSEDRAFNNFRNSIGLILQSCGWPLVRVNGAEADDVIASIAAASTDTVVIFTNDRDLRQLLSYPNVAVYQNPGIFYTRRMFLDEYGFDVTDYVFYKALVGDKSDNINGVNGWGPAKAKKHILGQSWLGALSEEEQDAYNRALQLCSLNFNLKCEVTQRVKSRPIYYKLLKKLYSDQCIKEITLAINRLDIVL